jgi:DNA polymerase-3 subunit gamma/tau
LVLEPIFSKIEKQSSQAGNIVAQPNISSAQSNNLTAQSGSLTAPPITQKFPNQIAHRPVKRMPGKEAFVIPSISEALKDSSEIKENITSIPNIASQKQIQENPFTQEQLVEVWKNFTERIDAPQLKSALSCRLPLLQENWLISYDLDNELQNQRITLEWKPQLLGYLRQMLVNEKIEIVFKILDIVDNTTSIPYTDAEKWEVLAQKYPALISLKNRFGLDFQ